MDINKKTAIVTGASTGLGAAIATTLVNSGATVYGLARNKKALDALQKDLGNSFVPTILDITDETAVKKWVTNTFSKEKTPDILVNNAGAGSFGKIDEMPSGEWYEMINTNLNGLYCITSVVVKLMKPKNEPSHILNIGSILGTTARAEGAAYCTTKYGVRGFSEALFKELRGDNIKVTCLNPGSIDTNFFKSSGIDAHSNMLQPNDIADTILHILKTPDNMLINEVTVRPLNPKAPK
jgi:NADP-dependent 3-hydroxy acid dehydrogenase YdfG